jgi:putative ABC transport system ATP-binding protein
MIDIQELTKVYSMGETEVRALDGVCLWIDAGEWVAITGPSGSGKSTLMNILGCLDQPSSGSYNLDGIEVAQMNDGAPIPVLLPKLQEAPLVRQAPRRQEMPRR